MLEASSRLWYPKIVLYLPQPIGCALLYSNAVTVASLNTVNRATYEAFLRDYNMVKSGGQYI